MLRLFKDNPSRLCDGISRREWLHVGGVSLLGLSLPALLRAEGGRRAAKGKPAKACILLYLAGGPSHLDMWDMKPTAPPEVRGEFKPIASSVTGIQVSD